jgi:hypothetical protein
VCRHCNSVRETVSNTLATVLTCGDHKSTLGKGGRESKATSYCKLCWNCHMRRLQEGHQPPAGLGATSVWRGKDEQTRVRLEESLQSQLYVLIQLLGDHVICQEAKACLQSHTSKMAKGACVCVCVCERERERQCVCVCVGGCL